MSSKKNKEFWCDLCQIETSTEQQFSLHLRGKKHKDNLYVDRSGFCPTKVSPASATLDQPYKDRGVIQLQSEGRVKFRCTLCKSGEMGTADDVQHHLSGKKHRKMESKSNQSSQRPLQLSGKHVAMDTDEQKTSPPNEDDQVFVQTTDAPRLALQHVIATSQGAEKRAARLELLVKLGAKRPAPAPLSKKQVLEAKERERAIQTLQQFEADEARKSQTKVREMLERLVKRKEDRSKGKQTKKKKSSQVLRLSKNTIKNVKRQKVNLSNVGSIRV